jgi:hypothetical protein
MHSMIKVAAGLVLASGTAIAGTWVEVPDAGQGIGGAFQNTSGVGALNNITGLTSVAGGDWVDAYCIKIVNPAAFFASVNATFPGAAGAAASFDTRLFLFTLAGAPVMMNDDWPATTSPFPSAIAHPTLYTGTGEITVDNPQLTTAGDYILAITGYSNNIENVANQDLFRVDSLFDFDALYGPDPAVGDQVPHHWENGGSDASGTYNIVLGGAEYSVPAPGALALLGTGGLVAFRRRR